MRFTYGPLVLITASVFHLARNLQASRATARRRLHYWTFRPEKNAARFANSAASPCPNCPKRPSSSPCANSVKMDEQWVRNDSETFYFRPFMIATEAFLGVRPHATCIFHVLARPRVTTSAPRARGHRLSPPTPARAGAPARQSAASNYAASMIAQTEGEARHRGRSCQGPAPRRRHRKSSAA